MKAALRDTRKLFGLFRAAYGQYKKDIGVLVVLGFVGGLLEGIGVNALIPLFSFFAEGSEATDVISQLIERFFTFIRLPFSLPYLLGFIVILFVLKAVALILFNYINIKIRADYERAIRSSLFQETLNSSWEELKEQKLGYLETVLVIDARNAAKLLSTLSSTIMVVTSLLAYFLVAINISVQFTLYTIVIGGILLLLVRPIIYRSRVVSKQTAAVNKEIAHLINESMIGMKVLKSLGQEGAVTRAADTIFSTLRGYQIKTAVLGNLAVAFIQPISVIYISVAFAIAFQYGVGFEIAAFAALVYLIHRIFSYFQLLQSNFNQMMNQVPYLEEVLYYRARARAHRENGAGKAPFVFTDALRFSNVSFSYAPKSTVLTQVSFEAAPGDMVGLIGLSGAGKTTIFDLMLRLFHPQEGTITLDDVPIQDIGIDAWRQHVGYVSQEVFLLNDTIANNIRFYSENVQHSDVVEAAKMAHIHDFIQTLPDKFETVVGERGMRLSAGQRQRIALARVLVRNPDVLLLDEATSALDNESELRIQEAIESLKGIVTVFVIAHRLSTVMSSDKLLVLEVGRIVESGSPQILLKNKDSHFYKMYNIRQ